MNDIAMGDFSDEDRRQFYRLIGYSVCGYGEVFTEDDVDSPLWHK